MIKIVQKLRPFSHTPGASCVIPGTHSILRAYPTRLTIDDQVVPLPLSGPVAEFTLQQDLERGVVHVFGKRFKLKIFASDAGFHVGTLDLPAEIDFLPNRPFERLSLGSHKAQEEGRMGLKEWIPLLFCLSQKIPPVPPQPLLGTARLLEFPEERSKLEAALEAFFKAAFKSLLVPRLIDDQYQGFSPDEPVQGSPFFLIQEGGKKIRSLFFRQNERRLSFLPHLPISFDAGRLVGLQVPGVGEIDFEWSKKTIRTAFIKASASGEVVLEFPREIKSFRVNRAKRQSVEEPLLLTQGKTFFLDQFRK
jgi:hypothetical protein